MNDTNKLELSVFASDEQQQVWLIARLDNLGKGASVGLYKLNPVDP